MVATMVIVIASVLIIVSLMLTNTFDIGLIMKTPGEHIMTLQNEGQMMLHNGLQGDSDGGSMLRSISTTHPILTMLFGIPLSFIPAPYAVSLATIITVCVLTGFLVLIAKNSSGNETILPIIAWMLTLQCVYDELRNPAFQFIASVLLYMALTTHAHGKIIRSGILLALAWFVQPAWIMLIIPLAIQGQWKTILAAALTYIAATLPFLASPYIWAYMMTLKETFLPPSGTFNIAALPRFLDIPSYTQIGISAGTFFCLLLIQLLRKPRTISLLALWGIGAILFTGSIIPSTYIVVPVLILLLVLGNHIEITPPMAAAMLGMAIPSPLTWLRIGWNQTSMTTSDTTLAAVWTAYWTLFLFIVLAIQINQNDTMDMKKSGK
jgi:hypothetical protein